MKSLLSTRSPSTTNKVKTVIFSESWTDLSVKGKEAQGVQVLGVDGAIKGKKYQDKRAARLGRDGSG